MTNKINKHNVLQVSYSLSICKFSLYVQAAINVSQRSQIDATKLQSISVLEMTEVIIHFVALYYVKGSSGVNYAKKEKFRAKIPRDRPSLKN